MRTIREEERILDYLESWLQPLYASAIHNAAHDIGHIRRMLKIAEIIIEDAGLLFLLKVAIWLHNLDRIEPRIDDIALFVSVRLQQNVSLSAEEIKLIAVAVANHSKLNEDSDSTLLQALKDIDRLDSLSLIGVLRAAAWHHDKPFYLEKDFLESPPAGEDSKAVVKSFVQDIKRVLEFWDMLRTPRAKDFGRWRYLELLEFVVNLKNDLKRLGEIK